MLDFKVGHSRNTTVDKLYHVNFVLSSTYDLKLCVLLFNLYINAQEYQWPKSNSDLGLTMPKTIIKRCLFLTTCTFLNIFVKLGKQSLFFPSLPERPVKMRLQLRYGTPKSQK